MIKQSKAAKYELAVHMANELNLKGKERKYFIEHRKKTTW